MPAAHLPLQSHLCLALHCWHARSPENIGRKSNVDRLRSHVSRCETPPHASLNQSISIVGKCSKSVLQAAGGHLQSLLDVRPPLPGLPQRTALAGVLSRLGPDGCASLQVRKQPQQLCA